MQTTYEQFVKTFKDNLHSVAEFDGEADQTLSVIVGALESSRLKQYLDELDQLRQKFASASGGGVAAASSAASSDKADGGRKVVPKAKKSAAVEAVEDDDKNAKTKRVTGYNVFVAEQVREKKHTMSEAAAVWKSMDTAARAPYIERATNQNSG